MADIKITELPQATSVSDSDELIIQQPSGTKRAGIADLPVGSPLSAGYGIDITNDIVSNTKPMNYEITGSVPSPTPLNADQLQGHPASYFQKLLTAGNGININNDVINSELIFDLLWTNEAPTNNFGPQDINIDTSEYKLFYVKYRLLNTATLRVGAFYHKDGARTLCLGLWNDIILYRIAAVSDKFYFEDGKSQNSYDGSATPNSQYMVPIEIYGIK